MSPSSHVRAPRRALLLLLVVALPRFATAEPLGQPIAIEDGSGGGAGSGKALAAFHEAVGRVQAKKGRARLLFYGDSHIARDHYTGLLRRLLQARFGDAGAGFVPLAAPYDHYRHQDLRVAPADGWVRVRPGQGQVEPCGVFGVALEAAGQAQSKGFVEPARPGGPGGRAARYDLFFLRQPGGGSLDVGVDGAASRRVATAAASREPGFERITTRDGPHRLDVSTAGNGSVRVFGVSVERPRPGVIVDTMGIPGARARDQLGWDEALQRAQLRRLAPDLVVLAYGTNEAIVERLSMSRYEGDLRVLVGRLRAALPRASCLLVGPSDLPIRQRDGTWSPRPRVAEIVDVQRTVAADLGCGFFDLVAFQGGLGAMPRWVAHAPPLALEDHTHFTVAGHELIAAALERALLAGL